MASVDDVREIALALPTVEERASGFTGEPMWRTKRGLVVWVRGPNGSDLRQLDEIGQEWPDGEVVAVRVESLEDKDALLAAEPEFLFTIPHFEGYSAVLVRLDRIDRERLVELITDAWLTRIPVRMAREWLAEHGLE